jgi:hypothetical protein
LPSTDDEGHRRGEGFLSNLASGFSFVRGKLPHPYRELVNPRLREGAACNLLSIICPGSGRNRRHPGPHRRCLNGLPGPGPVPRRIPCGQDREKAAHSYDDLHRGLRLAPLRIRPELAPYPGGSGHREPMQDIHPGPKRDGHGLHPVRGGVWASASYSS